MPRVFFITGTSRGLGHALAQVLLDAGEYVVATARNPATLSFRGTTPANYLPLKLDVTSTPDIEVAFTSTLEKFKRIDVVINNAAFGLVGPLETLTDAQIRQQFDTNFFPVATITRKAMGVMRTQSPPGGVIMQVSSVGTLVGFPMLSAMCASKWAIEGFTEAVRQEMKPEWGIKLVSVKPDTLDTDAHTKSMVYGEVVVPQYAHMDGRAFVKSLMEMPAVDAAKAAKAMYALSKMEDPPMNAILGDNVRKIARDKMKRDEELLDRDDLVGLVKRND
ncbi:NAD(P)-binding protein [Trematosphaeria pertusa]|uniref:NAD(P)-binding protein n=1 Tax=Trematosphaeria pertusa TaxID=390896 RepID=A0A6A6J196_9PLEO|nr:NAD(P)-binding protein [Trematosphaeria pertusa]KAF2256479.1 NAD(P)-binding protein [Trematosphaeria pertusa]